MARTIRIREEMVGAVREPPHRDSGCQGCVVYTLDGSPQGYKQRTLATLLFPYHPSFVLTEVEIVFTLKMNFNGKDVSHEKNYFNDLCIFYFAIEH